MSDGVEEISTEEGLALLEQHAQERFGLSWSEFHTAYLAGQYQGTTQARQAEELAFLAPLAGPAVVRTVTVGSEELGRFGVTIHQEVDGTFIARVDEVPGCFAGGPTVDDAVRVLLEVIPVYLADTRSAATE